MSVPYVAAHLRCDRLNRHLNPAGAQYRPPVLGPEQAISSSLHMGDVFGMRPDAAQDAEHALNEERRLHHAAIGKMRQRVQMANIIAFDFEARPILRTRGENVFDILEGVLEDALARAFEIRALPVMPEALEPVEHRIATEIHPP